MTKQQLNELDKRVTANEQEIKALIELARQQNTNLSTLASSVIAHDDQIEGLIVAVRRMSRQWQAYLNRLPPQ